jgi:very-short-patch-repair endonuclease
MRMTNPTMALELQLRALWMPQPEHEYRFSIRKFRFDMAWPAHRLAVEIDGGIWAGGRHTRGLGFEADCEKINLAIELGWKVLRYTPAMIESGLAAKQIARILGRDLEDLEAMNRALEPDKLSGG